MYKRIRKMKSLDFLNVVLALMISIVFTSCNAVKKPKNISNLSDYEIESILLMCHEDTIMVLGRFVEFEMQSVLRPIPIGQYKYVADLLNRPFERLSDVESMRDIVHDLYIRKRGKENSMIAIPPVFVPKIKITEELNGVSLRDLVLSDLNDKNIETKYQKESEVKFMKEWSSSLRRPKDDSKYIPEQSNLAKVFFLQDKKKFIELNKYYYYESRRVFMKDYIESQKQSEEKSAQAMWNDYL